MDANRLRWGALAWLATLQFFVVETIAQLRLDARYSRVDDVISDLGTAVSPAALLMNSSFVVQGGLILAGVLLLAPSMRRGSGRAAAVLLGLAGLGVLLVGLFPSDGNAALHATGAVLHLLGGGLGLIALAYVLRPRSEALGTALALLGLVGTAATVFFVTGITGVLGSGGTERVAAYVIPVGLAVAGLALLRPRRVPAAASAADRPTRRELREQERAERARRERERDEALEAAARRRAGDLPDRAGDATDPDDDPWAPSGRRSD